MLLPRLRLSIITLIALAVAAFPLGGRVMTGHAHAGGSPAAAVQNDCHGLAGYQAEAAADVAADIAADLQNEPGTGAWPVNCCDLGCHVIASAPAIDHSLGFATERPANAAAAAMPPGEFSNGLRRPPRITHIG